MQWYSFVAAFFEGFFLTLILRRLIILTIRMYKSFRVSKNRADWNRLKLIIPALSLAKIARHLKSIRMKNLLVIFIGLGIFITSGPMNLPHRMIVGYTVVWLITVLVLIVRGIYKTVTGSTPDVLMHSLFWLFMMMIIGATLFDVSLQLSSDGSLKFVVVCIACIFCFVPITVLLKRLADTTVPAIIVILLGMIAFFVCEGVMLIFFGIYNVSQNPHLIGPLLNAAPSPAMLELVKAGGEKVFEFPSTTTTTWTDILEYFFGMVVNIVVIGFFVSYMSSIWSPSSKNSVGNGGY